MTLVCFANRKGAPGATTAMLAAASLWPMARRLVVEADPDGGALAARFGLGYEPGLVTVAAAGRRSLSETEVLKRRPIGCHIACENAARGSSDGTAAQAGQLVRRRRARDCLRRVAEAT